MVSFATYEVMNAAKSDLELVGICRVDFGRHRLQFPMYFAPPATFRLGLREISKKDVWNTWPNLPHAQSDSWIKVWGVYVQLVGCTNCSSWWGGETS